MKNAMNVCHMTLIETQKNRRGLPSVLYEYSADNNHWRKLKKGGTSKRCEANVFLKEIEPAMGIEKYDGRVCWLILCVNLTGPQGTRIFG